MDVAGLDSVPGVAVLRSTKVHIDEQLGESVVFVGKPSYVTLDFFLMDHALSKKEQQRKAETLESSQPANGSIRQKRVIPDDLYSVSD